MTDQRTEKKREWKDDWKFHTISLYRQGVSTLEEGYLDGFEEWAGEILERCPQAIAVVPDVIGGTEEQNAELARQCWLPNERCMAIWHLDESLDYLLYLCESFGWVGFGSAGKYWKPGTPEWHARVQEAFAAIDKWEAESDGAYIRPRLHMMRAQSLAHLYPFDSSDSCNVAMNHGRYRNTGPGHVGRLAARVDKKIQASAGPASEHQIKRPLIEPALYQLAEWFEANYEIKAAQAELFTWKEAA